MVTGPRKPTTTTQLGIFGRSMAQRMMPTIATKIRIATTMTSNFSPAEVGLRNQSTCNAPFFQFVSNEAGAAPVTRWEPPLASADRSGDYSAGQALSMLASVVASS